MAGLRGRLLAAAAALTLSSVALTWSSEAAGQTAPRGGGFGSRDAFAFSVERVFGFQTQDFGDNSTDTLGFHPVFWGSIGLWSVMDTGLTFGALVGATRFTITDDDDNLEFTFNIFALEPRIGYAISQSEVFGLWARGGPSLHVINRKTEFDFGGTTQSESETDYVFGIGGEVYAVITPVPHVGILVGPHALFNIAGGTSEDCDPGDECDDPEYSSFGLTVGLMGEFW